jgi:hypothetical protein
LQKKVGQQEEKSKEIGDYLTSLDEAVAELQKKHPAITQEDLNAVKQPLEKAINEINGKIDFLIQFLKLEDNQTIEENKRDKKGSRKHNKTANS